MNEIIIPSIKMFAKLRVVIVLIFLSASTNGKPPVPKPKFVGYVTDGSTNMKHNS